MRAREEYDDLTEDDYECYRRDEAEERAASEATDAMEDEVEDDFTEDEE